MPLCFPGGLWPDWFTIAAGWVVFPITVVAHSAGLHGHAGSWPVLAVAAACCVRSTPRAAAAVGVLCWAFATGFLVNSYGVLTFQRADQVFLGACVTVTVTACLTGAFRRVRRLDPSVLSGAG